MPDFHFRTDLCAAQAIAVIFYSLIYLLVGAVPSWRSGLVLCAALGFATVVHGFLPEHADVGDRQWAFWGAFCITSAILGVAALVGTYM